MATFLNLLWRSLVVAFVYTLTNMIVGGMVMQSAEGLRTPTNPALLLTTTFVSGLLAGAVLGSVAPYTRASRTGALLTWASILFFNMAAVVLEGYYFAPGLLPAAVAPRVLVLHFFTALVTGAAIAFLFPAGRKVTPPGIRAHRTPLSGGARFLLSVATYVVLYYVFGLLNYTLVTGPYYASHPALAVPPAGTVLWVAALHGVLIVLSIIPLIRVLQVPRKRLLWTCGSTLFIMGGLLPLLFQVSALPPVLLWASGVEIFFQVFPTGVMAAFLLGRPATPQTATTPANRMVLEH